MSLNKYNQKFVCSTKPNIKETNDNNLIINQTNSFNIPNKILNNNNFLIIKKNINKKYISYKNKSIRKDKIRYSTPSLMQTSNNIFNLDINNQTLPKKDISNFNIYELKYTNSNKFKYNQLFRNKSYNINKRKYENIFSPKIKTKVQKLFKILESSNFPKSTNSYNLKDNIHYNRKTNYNKEKYHNTKKNTLIKYNSFINNKNSDKFDDKNAKKFQVFENKFSDNNNYENYISLNENNNFQKINKIEENIDDKINKENNNIKLNKNLINYLNRYKGNQKKIMEECLINLNFNYADDNYNYNYQINYNNLDNYNNNRNNNINIDQIDEKKIINDNNLNNNSNYIKTINQDNKENIYNINDNDNDNNNKIKKDFSNYKKINFQKNNKNKNIEINLFNPDEDIKYINKKAYFPLSNKKNRYYKNKSLLFEGNENTSTLIQKPKTKLELLLTKIPRHHRYENLNEKTINKYSINIPKFFNYKKKINTNNFNKELSISRFPSKNKNSAIMPPNNYNSQFIKKVFKSFYNK